MSESALAWFLATRDPAQVSKEWTSATYEDARIEGMTDRGAARHRLKRVLIGRAEIELGKCANEHDLAEMSYSVTRGELKRWCRACARDRYRKRREYRKAHEERNAA